MTSSRQPGPTGLAHEVPDLNDGTLVRALSPRPGVIGIENNAAFPLISQSSRTELPAAVQSRLAEDRVIQNLHGKDKGFVVEGKTFRLIRADQWPDVRNDERYEIVARDEARRVFEKMASVPAISQAVKSAGQAAASRLADTSVRYFDSGLLLLRTVHVRYVNSGSAEPAFTPSQLAKMRTQGEQKEEHWIEIELVWEDGTSVPGAKYLIVTPDKEERTGVTDSYGRARIDGIVVPGQCKISFPEIDGEAWKKV
jgi:hypothetical protein